MFCFVLFEDQNTRRIYPARSGPFSKDLSSGEVRRLLFLCFQERNVVTNFHMQVVRCYVYAEQSPWERITVVGPHCTSWYCQLNPIL